MTTYRDELDAGSDTVTVGDVLFQSGGQYATQAALIAVQAREPG